MKIRNVSLRGPLIAASASVAILFAVSQATATTNDDASWQPNSSEKLVKLPASYLKKAVDQDYRRSPLAAEMADTESRIKLKLQTLGDLRDATGRAVGELKIELRHQLLAEKRAYLSLMARHHDLRRRRAQTRIRLYENLLRKLGRDAAGMTPQRIALADKQDSARKRFDASVGKVDMVLFRSSATSESRYARDYAKNVAAIESLVHAINRHPMNAKAEIDGKPVSKQDYLRQLAAENEAELATVKQEEGILGYMAKLIGLDALALSEAVTGADPHDEPEARDNASVASAVEFFVSR
jgi:hypothetical protein